MRYLSVCSGIEAATVAWHQLGWTPEAYSEIEKFPASVLAHHYPQTPNLGDMTNYKEWNIGDIDLLVGGTPCQSFSVAGLRKGLDDPRGNLCLTFLGMVDHWRPAWVVWENVPGVLSDKTNAFGNMLDSFGELGYIVDTEILDAQFFGVPQRRRRVFICAQSREDFLSKRTPTSALTIIQFLAETLHGLLADVLYPSEKERTKLALPYLSSDGVRKRIGLFWPAMDTPSFGMLLKHLTEAWAKCHLGVESSESFDGELGVEHMLAARLMASPEVPQNIRTEESLKKNLAGLYKVMRLCTTSTLENRITHQEICMCIGAAQTICALICLLPPSSPAFWSADLSASTLLQELTNYVKRQANDEVSAKSLGFCSWGDLIAQTELTNQVVGYIGDWRRAAAVLFESHSLQGHPAPSRKKGEEVAGSLASSSGGCNDQNRTGGDRPPGTDVDTADSLIVTPCHTTGAGFWKEGYGTLRGREQDSHENLICMSTGQASAEIGIGTTLNCNHEAPIICHGTQDPCVSDIAFAQGRNNGGENVLCAPVAFGVGESPDLEHCLRSGASKADKHESTTYVASPMQVRRLTPTECERLQGFPDGYSNIPWRNKPESPDGQRYRALGNSMAVPCMRWLGERIQMVDDI